MSVFRTRPNSRREFLERSMLTTAAILAAQSRFGSQALAQDNQSPSVSPNEQIHVAVIGGGAEANRISEVSQGKREPS